jgi:hypothetical protein
MNTRSIPLIILVLLLAPLAHAATIEQVSPAVGATIDPIENGFSFRTDSHATIKECTLFIDNEPKKTITYNDYISNTLLWFGLELPDGEHTWSVICSEYDNAIVSKLSSSTIAFTAKTVESPITVESSGIFRGSMAHTFNFRNAPDQEPIVVKKLAAGDFIWINLKVAPSTITKELYVRRSATEDGKRYLYLEDLKKRDTYKILEGENATVNISQTSVIVKFIGIELNRANVVVYPKLSANAAAPNETKNDTENGTEGTPPAEEVKSADEKDNATSPPPITDITQEPPKQGVFTRFFSWLVGLFGA